MRTLIVSQNGRESSLAWRMAEHSTLCAFIAHKNPTIIHHVERTGGVWAIGKPTDPQAVCDFAIAQQIELALVSSDDPLAAGVIDALRAANIPCVGPTKAGAEIEWSKTYSRDLVQKVAPEVNPFFRIAHTPAEIDAIFDEIGTMEVAVKPSGLTGGKGVKVMGPHLADAAKAKAYAHQVIADAIGGGAAVIIEEKITGVEFNIQIITDGVHLVTPPATFDYPYRLAGDTGPGTGGMGSYNLSTPALPFMTQAHYDKAIDISRKVITELRQQGRHFSGVLYPGFFLTNKGELKLIEFNARFGDPECMNIMMMLEGNFVDLLKDIAAQKLNPAAVRFKNACSTVIYLVAPDYGYGRKSPPLDFHLDVEAIEAAGCHVFFASSERVEGADKTLFRTVGTSRCIAIGTTAPTLEEARNRIKDAITAHTHGPLEWREDIATEGNIAAAKAILKTAA
ncbi:MAG: phosphoribosylamine--glycine ligase [Alphaproteobacteria bacterium]|nr:phosphoribosylamine--glycine ligase [Alphaproteobacteria bacterium]